MSELNRRGRRRKFDGSGKIALGFLRSASCTVSDLSNSGARLGVPEDQKIPETFWLKISGFRRKRMAETRWRQGNHIGVEFTLD